VSDESQHMSASGDVIGALSDRVGELSKRVASLEAELEAARKRGVGEGKYGGSVTACPTSLSA